MFGTLTLVSQGRSFFSPPSGHKLTYDLGGDSQTTQTRSSSYRKRLSLASRTLLGFCMVLGLVFALRAQSGEESGRKVIRSEKPDYPVLLKNARIGGLVRLRVTVQANGTVASIAILGGSPVLAECAVKSVMKWKYAPAASRSNEIVTVEFGIR